MGWLRSDVERKMNLHIPESLRTWLRLADRGGQTAGLPSTRPTAWFDPPREDTVLVGFIKMVGYLRHSRFPCLASPYSMDHSQSLLVEAFNALARLV